MVNLVPMTATPKSGYLTGRMPFSTNPVTVSGTLTADEKVFDAARDSAQQAFNTKYQETPGEGLRDRVMRFGLASGIDVVDTLASIMPNIERGDIWQAAADSGMEGLADWQARNKSGVELGSAALLSIGTGYMMERYVFTKLASSLLSSSALQGGRLTQLANMVPKARATALQAQMDNAALGTLARVTNPATQSAIRNFYLATAAQNTAKAVTTESAIVALGHNNEAIWSEDMANNMFWFGLGIALPAGVGALQSRAELRASANSIPVMEARRQALDPNDFIKDRDLIGDPTLPYNPDQKMKQSAVVTELAFEARQSIPASVSPETKTILERQGLQARLGLESELKKFVSKPIEDGGIDPAMKNKTFGKINFSDESPMKDKQRAHLLDAIKTDPALLMEVDALGTTANLKFGLKKRTDQINKLLSSNIPEEVTEGRRLSKQEPMILINGRWHAATNDAVEFAEYDPSKLKFTQYPGTGGKDWQFSLPNGHTLRLTPSARISGKPFSQREISDRLGIIQSLKKLSGLMTQGKPNLHTPYVIGDADDWVQDEFALYHAARGGKIDYSKSGTIRTLDDLRFRALKGKIRDMKRDGNFNFKDMDNWQRRKYNLPEAQQVERIHDGTSKALFTVLGQVESGTIKSYDEAKQLYNELLTRHEMIATTRAEPVEFSGDMWSFNENAKGDWYTPIVATHEMSTKNPLKRGTRAQQAEELAINKTVKYQTLTRNAGPESVVARTTEIAHVTPEGQNAFRIGGIADEQGTGLGQGLGAEAGSILSGTHRYRDSVTGTATFKLNQAAQDVAMSVTKNDHLILQEDAILLNSSANKASRDLYNQFATLRPGWDLLPNGATLGTDGKWRFLLAKTANNESRLGREILEDADEFMVNHITGQDLVLDDIGMKFFRKLNRLLDSKRIDENRIRTALGLTEIRHTPYYLPSEDTKGKFIAFVIDGKTGKTLPDRSILAESAEDFQNQIKAAYQKLQPHEHIHTQDEISFSQDLYDQAQQNFVNARFVGRTNASARGALAGDKIRQNTVQDHLKYLQDKNVHLASATLRTVYDDQIQIAKMRRAMARIEYGIDPQKASGKLDKGPRTIFDDYLMNIAGPEIADVPKRAITQLMDSMEAVAQKGLTASWQAMRTLAPTQVVAQVRDFAVRLGAPLKHGYQDSFDKLTKELGPYMPYKSLDDYVDQINRAGKPPEVREIANKMNRWDATWRLRYLELPNAAMNMMGIIANMPAILANSKTPVIGQLVNGSGKKVGIVDTMKILTSGTTESLTRKYKADWDYAKLHGGLKQGVAEIREIMSTIELTKGNPSEARIAWRRAFYGDKTILNPTVGTPDWFKKHGIDGILAIANDSTENWSRQWAHGIGLKLADLHGITGEAQRFNFANSIADQAIANYSPLNRGEVFQSAFGSMFGLYQTYAMNYTSRMFRYLEQGDYKALMRQAAMQSAMFGVGSNIGWNQLEWLEDAFTGDEATLSDMVYARFGPIVGGALAHGGVADFAKLFGAPSGIALYTRGDTNVRFNFLPTDSSGAFDFTKMSAALGTTKQLGDGMIQMLQAMWGDDSLTTGQRISEIAANMVPNRTIKGAITVGLNDGYETDRYGAVTAVNQGAFESIVRMLGLRTTRQQDEIDMYYANRSTLDKQAARMEQLREETRALIRDGGLENKLADIFESYTSKGGDPSNFKTWIRQTVESATTTRGLRDMTKAMNSQKMQTLHARYGFVDAQ